MATEYADYIFYGGTIITMEEENPSAEALAVKGANILAVGKRDEVFALKGPSTEFVHLVRSADPFTWFNWAPFSRYYDGSPKIGKWV